MGLKSQFCVLDGPSRTRVFCRHPAMHPDVVHMEYCHCDMVPCVSSTVAVKCKRAE